MRDTTPGNAPTIARLSAGRAVAAVTGAGLLGTVGEAGLLHFRGAYHDPFMYAAGHGPACRRRADRQRGGRTAARPPAHDAVVAAR